MSFVLFNAPIIHFKVTWIRFSKIIKSALVGGDPQLLWQHNLFAKLSKYSFGLQKVDYLRHIISGKGVVVDKEKRWRLYWIDMCLLMQNKLKVSFALQDIIDDLYRRMWSCKCSFNQFIKEWIFFSRWSSTTTFAKLKVIVTKAPIRSLPNLSQPFILETNASSLGIGPVLRQNHHPLVFFPKSLLLDKKLSTYVR